MKSIQPLALAIIFFLAKLLIAQEATEQRDYGWKSEVVGTLNLTQASFSNWEQGGENTLAWQIKLKTTFTLDQEKYSWATTGTSKLGFAKVAGSEARKSADEIKIESVYTRKLNPLLNPFLAVTAKSQFVPGFEYGDEDSKTKVSKFLDPGYFTQSAGVNYSRGKNFKTRFGATLKETVTNSFPVPYADDPATLKIEKTKVEPGISSTTDFKRRFEENVLFSSKLDLFSDLEAFDRIDVLWENNLVLKVSKFINVSLDIDLLYDKDVSDRRQIKQVLAVGLTYAFL